MKTVVRGCLSGILTLALAAPAFAQASKSATLAAQLAAALSAAKLDSIAAKDPSSPDAFVGALYFPGVQLLVVGAKYAVPPLLVEKLNQKAYREVYIDLNSASVAGSKVFIEDLGADGLKADRGDTPAYDTFEAMGKRTVFDGDWKKQNLSKEDYTKAFEDADERYSEILSALLAQLKKTS